MPRLPLPACLALSGLMAACTPPAPPAASPLAFQRFVLGQVGEVVPEPGPVLASPAPARETPRVARPRAASWSPVPAPSPTPAPSGGGGSGGGGSGGGGSGGGGVSAKPTPTPTPTPTEPPVSLGLTVEAGGFEDPAASEAAVVEEPTP
ncbi:MAG: hypothetical protein VKS61_03210 [Candidatus Sericytochromatia bacterium]|nr:hypothetical protein [Candidatus Sericytochromatia bacterium]